MYWDDYGYLIEKNRYNENTVIAEMFTKDHGKVLGLIYGATSKKISSSLQLGNKFHINYKSKNENRIGYFKLELDKIYTPFFFEDRKKLSCIISCLRLIKILTVENQANINVYNLINKLFIFLGNEFWINKIVFWELELLKYVGYDLELKSIVCEENVNNNKFYYVLSNNEKKYIPNFLVEKNFDEINITNIINGFILIGDYLEKSILKPNNIIYPLSRKEFLDCIK